ncbi:PREDICTED: achaete-scute homolog 1-like [Nicrophorus vespilloides]|uniref:Achaete-scute homolog 1-like n=1 Tax=Nicrophorus vespilloides TaxID=110193 RepID=A0ABM1MDV4_NICVS|nr:PREDICTED: achaete-scute homolog 1-like [Nicrophorus vespilloides]
MPNYWTQKEVYDSWMDREAHVTAPSWADGDDEDNGHCDVSKQPLREKNCRKNGKYTHVPHRDKPPQVVARRNARERNRVQAVNSAFMKLRKAVPYENNRGKRISKVKTLQNAIEYINNLQELLRNDGYCEPLNIVASYYYPSPPNVAVNELEYGQGGGYY